MKSLFSLFALVIIACSFLTCHKEKYDSGIYLGAKSIPLILKCIDTVSPTDSNYFFCTMDGWDWCCNPGKDDFIVHIYHGKSVLYPVNNTPGPPIDVGKKISIILEPLDSSLLRPSLVIEPPPIVLDNESIFALIDTIFRLGVEFPVSGKFNLNNGRVDPDDYRSKAQISFNFPYRTDEDQSLKLFALSSAEGSHNLKVTHIQKSDRDFYWRYWLKLEFNSAFQFNEYDRRVDPALYGEFYVLKNGQLSFAFDVLK